MYFYFPRFTSSIGDYIGNYLCSTMADLKFHKQSQTATAARENLAIKEIRQGSMSAKTLNWLQRYEKERERKLRKRSLGRSSRRKLIASTLALMKWFHNSNHVRRQLWQEEQQNKKRKDDIQQQSKIKRTQSLSLSPVSDLNRNCSPTYLFRQITTNCLLPFVFVF